MTQKTSEVGDVVAPTGTQTLMVVLELMDDSFAWVCGLEDSQNVELIEIANLTFISKGGRARCRRLQPKVKSLPSSGHHKRMRRAALWIASNC